MVKKFEITSMNILADIMIPKLKEGRNVKFTVVGNSMYPLFRSGRDNVVMSPPENLKKYDVILYKRDDGDFVLHRIVGIEKDGFTLIGDNQFVKEYNVKRGNVIAKMTEFERDGKYFSVNSKPYVFYTRIWCSFIKQRGFLIKIMRAVKVIFDKCHKKKL